MDSIVGTEYLPNAHIEKIIFEDNPNQYNITAIVCFYDHLEKTWSKNEKFGNYLYMKTMFGTRNSLEEGMVFDITRLGTSGTAQQTIPFNNFESNQVEIRGKKYWKFSFERKLQAVERDRVFESSPNNLYLACAAAIKSRQLVEDEGLNLNYTTSEDYFGSVNAEIILRDGEVVNKGYLFKDELMKLFILGFLGCGICGAFPFLAGKTTTIVNMGIIYSSSPIFIILISAIFFRERLSKSQYSGILICLLGVILIIIKANINLLINLKFTIGDLWMLGASIGWALYTIYLFHWKSKLPLLQRFTLISMFGAISLLPFFIFEGMYILQTSYDLNFIFWVLFAALSPSIIAFLLFNFVNNKLGASITGSVLYLYTVYGAIYGFLFFDEKLEIYHLAGTLMVFIGIFLVKKNVKNA